MLIPFWFDLPWHTLDTFSSYWQLEINFLIDIWDLSPTNFTWFVHEFLYKIHMVCTWTSLPILPILWRQMALQNDKTIQYYFWSYGHLAYKGISLYLIPPSDYTTFTRSHSDESAPFAKLWFLKRNPLTFLPRSSSEFCNSICECC